HAAAAAPRSAMNFRRIMRLSLRPGPRASRAYHIRERCWLCPPAASSGHAAAPPPKQRDELPPIVAVGTCVSSHAPRTEPYVRLSRIRPPPRVCDGKLPYAFHRL